MTDEGPTILPAGMPPGIATLSDERPPDGVVYFRLYAGGMLSNMSIVHRCQRSGPTEPSTTESVNVAKSSARERWKCGPELLRSHADAVAPGCSR